MDQQLSQILVAVLADARQPRLAAGSPLPGNQTEPCRQVAPMRESLGLADGRDQRRRVHDADPRDCGQSPRGDQGFLEQERSSLRYLDT